MTREEAIMANDSQKAKKIKTPFAKMIVEGNQEKPYFSILYFKLIERLKSAAGGPEGIKMCHDAALAIKALRADLVRVTAERDAAVADIAAILAEVEEIRRGYGVDNADADNAFADLCGNYCAKCGNNCYGEAEDYRCKNFEWRGIKEG